MAAFLEIHSPGARIYLRRRREKAEPVAHLHFHVIRDLPIGAAWNDFKEVAIGTDRGLRKLPKLQSRQLPLMYLVFDAVDLDREGAALSPFELFQFLPLPFFKFLEFSTLPRLKRLDIMRLFRLKRLQTCLRIFTFHIGHRYLRMLIPRYHKAIRLTSQVSGWHGIKYAYQSDDHS